MCTGGLTLYSLLRSGDSADLVEAAGVYSFCAADLLFVLVFFFVVEHYLVVKILGSDAPTFLVCSL